MPTNPYLLLGLAIVLEVIATSCLRPSQGFTRLLPSLVVALGYGGAFYLMSRALQSLPLGYSYAVWSGVGTALTAIIGWTVFHDQFQPLSLVGIALIIGGVVVLNMAGSGH